MATLLVAMVAVSTLVQQVKAAESVTFRVVAIAVDSLTGESLPYVTCSVSPESNPQQVITRFAGDAEGRVNGELKTPGTYLMTISFVGKQPATKRFTVGEANPEVDLGKIRMGASDQALSEVEVVANKPLIRADADKIIYDTEQDPEAQSSTVLDMQIGRAHV